MPHRLRAEIPELTRRREAIAPKVAPAPWREAAGTLPLSIFLGTCTKLGDESALLAQPMVFLTGSEAARKSRRGRRLTTLAGLCAWFRLRRLAQAEIFRQPNRISPSIIR